MRKGAKKKKKKKKRKLGEKRCMAVVQPSSSSSSFSFLLSRRTTMPSKLRKAIGAVKDQTSISLAKVSTNNSSNLDIAVLKATTHDEIPTDDRYINDVLLLISSNKIYAAACAQAIAKRISRTHNWIVALKSIMLVLRIFQNGDPNFPHEVLHTMKRGAKILNLSSFRDDSNSSPWDYTAFVRTFALYLDERLECFLKGKLQRRMVCRNADMKPAMLLDRITYWQRLLDRVLATRPTGAAKTNRLVQISLYSVVQESFDLYRDISDALTLLLDSFFHLHYQSCVAAFKSCMKASKQFEELGNFYTLCKSMGVGRTSEYPSVQKISDELIETLHEFLKDQASFTTTGNGRTHVPHFLVLRAPTSTAENTPSNSNRREGSEQSETSEQAERMSEERDSDMASEQHEQQTLLEDFLSVNEAETSPSVCIDRRNNSAQDLRLFDDDHPPHEEQQPTVSGPAEDLRDGWELALAESANNLYNQASVDHKHQYSNYSNPFLSETAMTIFPVADTFSSFPTFQAIPTVCAQNGNETNTNSQIEDDPFAPCTPITEVHILLDGSRSQRHLLHEQQLWLHHQNKIIARHIA